MAASNQRLPTSVVLATKLSLPHLSCWPAYWRKVRPGVVDPKTAIEWYLEEGTTTLTISVALPFVILSFLLLIAPPNPQKLLSKSTYLLVQLLVLNAQLALCRHPMINLLVKGCLRTRHALQFYSSAPRCWRPSSKSMTTSWESRLHLWRCTCTTGSVLLHRKGWSLRSTG